MIKRESDRRPSWGVCSSGRFLFVEFFSDKMISYSGFSATYRVVPRGKETFVPAYPFVFVKTFFFPQKPMSIHLIYFSRYEKKTARKKLLGATQRCTCVTIYLTVIE